MIRGGEPLGTYWQKFPQLAEMFARTRHLFTPPTEYRSEYEHYAIPGGTTIFARDPQTTVKVWSGDVGYPGDQWYLDDMGSLNGTYVNRSRIESQRLQEGDEVQIGKYKLTFHVR